MLQAVLDGVADGLLIGLTALGLSLIYAVQRFPNVSQGGLVAAGAYMALGVSGVVQSPVVVGLSTIAFGFLLGALVYLGVVRPFRRESLMTLLVVTIGLEFILDYTVALTWGYDVQRYPFGITGQLQVLGLHVNKVYIATSVFALTSMAVVGVVLRRTRIGQEMRAVCDNAPLARLVGIQENRVLCLTWAIVGALAALAGLSHGLTTQLQPLMGWHLLLPSFAAAILGGLGNLTGAVLGGVSLGVGMELFSLVLPTVYTPVFSFVVLAALLLVRPEGLFRKASRI